MYILWFYQHVLLGKSARYLYFKIFYIDLPYKQNDHNNIGEESKKISSLSRTLHSSYHHQKYSYPGSEQT